MMVDGHEILGEVGQAHEFAQATRKGHLRFLCVTRRAHEVQAGLGLTLSINVVEAAAGDRSGGARGGRPSKSAAGVVAFGHD